MLMLGMVLDRQNQPMNIKAVGTPMPLGGLAMIAIKLHVKNLLLK